MGVVNQMLVQLLRGYNNKHPNTCDEKLFYIQHFYNKALHSSTKKYPFETYFGYSPPFDIVYGQHKVEAGLQGDEKKASTFMDKIKQIHMRVQEQLEKSQQLYKYRLNQHGEDHKFHVGDKVWLYLHKDQLQGETNKLNPLRHKLSKNIELVIENTFELKIPRYM